jgi:hypothetical protein
MFKNKAIQVQLVNTKKQEAEAPATVETLTVDPEQIAKIATEYTVKAIGAVGLAFAANRLLSTACEIAVVVVKAKCK